MRWRAGGILAFGVVVAVLLAAPAHAGDDGPSGHWELESTSIEDSSGGGHEGTAAGTSVTDGAHGSALEFSGTGVATIPRDPAFEPTNELTVSVWVRRDGSPGSYSYVIAKGNLGCFAASWAFYTGGGSGLTFYVFDGSSGVSLSPDAGPEVWDGEWHNVVGTYDGEHLRLFLDGTEVGTGTPATLTIGYGLDGDDLHIGNYGPETTSCSATTPFTGAIDEVAVWARALEPVEVEAIQEGAANASGGGSSTDQEEPAGGPPAASAQVNADRAPIGATLQQVDDISFSPEDIARSLAVAAGIILLIVFPGALFNATLEENYDEVSGWFARFRRERPASPNTDDQAGPRRPIWDTWLGFALFMAASAVMYSLLSPASSLDNALVSFAGILLGLVIVTLLFAWPIRQHFRRELGDKGHIHVVPATLLIAAVCVAASRIADFQPGYLYGLIAGYAFSRTLAEEDEAPLVLRSSLTLLVFALAAWALRLPLDSSANEDSASVALLIGDSVLATIFVGAVEGLVFGMIPIKFLAGEKLYRWDRMRWLAVIGAGTFLFVHVLLDPDAAYLVDTNTTSLTATLWLFGIFATVSVLFWAYFKVRKREGVAAP